MKKRLVALAITTVVTTGCSVQEQAKWASLLEWWNRPAAVQVPCREWLGATRSGGIPEVLVPEMHRIMYRESRCFPGAHHLNGNGSIDRGLYEINSIWVVPLIHVGIIHSAEDLYNPGLNAKAADYVLSVQGLYAWKATSG